MAALYADDCMAVLPEIREDVVDTVFLPIHPSTLEKSTANGSARVGLSAGTADIREKPLPSQPPWTDDSLHAVFVHTHFRLSHHEFLSTVTPEEFRAATLYPIGLDVIPIIEGAIKSVRQALREHAEAQARSAVQKELQLLLDARKAAEGENR